jgi:hypothetical protein
MAALLLGGFGMGMIAPILVDIVMSAVPPRDAGAASGVTNTVSQIGAAAGLAVVGALFIAFLHGQAAPAVDAVTPQLRADLATAGVPTAAQDELVAAFRRCALDRAEQPNPPSCQPQPAAQAADGASFTTAPAVRDALARAGEAARREVFDHAAARTLWYAVGAFALAFLLSFALPHDYDETNHSQPPSRPNGRRGRRHGAIEDVTAEDAPKAGWREWLGLAVLGLDHPAGLHGPVRDATPDTPQPRLRPRPMSDAAARRGMRRTLRIRSGEAS